MDKDLTKFYYEPIYNELKKRVDTENMIRNRDPMEFIAGVIYTLDVLKQIIDNPEDFVEKEVYN